MTKRALTLAADLVATADEIKALLTAIEANDLTKARLLLKKSPSSARHWKPIMDAAFAGSAPLVDLLLRQGADPNQRSPNSHRHTPLVRAVEWKKTIPRTDNHRQVVEVLLKAGADPELTGGVHQWSPLAHAAMSDEAGLWVLLGKQRPLDLAHGAMLYDATAVKRRLNKEENSTDAVGRNAFHYLCASGLHRKLGSSSALAIADILLDAGINVDAAQTNLVNEKGWCATPLWWAVGWQDHLALAERLLHAGANPNNAIFAAAFDGSAAMMHLLLQHGADLEHRVDGKTVLLSALGFKRSQHLQLMLAHGANANAKTAEGETALHIAVNLGVRPEAIGLLLEHGADATQRNHFGETAIDCARRLKRDAALKTLSRQTRAIQAPQGASARATAPKKKLKEKAATRARRPKGRVPMRRAKD